jgi:hypothetical protein
MSFGEGGEYARRLAKALERGIIDAGTVANAEIGHDDTCGVFSGRPCDCDPDILISTNRGIFRIDANGSATQAGRKNKGRNRK